METWLDIEEFCDYEVSSDGRVRNANTRHVLGIYNNGHDVMQVVMRKQGRPCARAVSRLVAHAFLDPAPDDCVPFHIDRNFANNMAHNLDWKPRWWAINQARQSKRDIPRDPRRVRAVKTGIVYDNALVCAKEIGGLENLVILTAQNIYGATYLGSAYEFLFE